MRYFTSRRISLPAVLFHFSLRVGVSSLQNRLRGKSKCQSVSGTTYMHPHIGFLESFDDIRLRGCRHHAGFAVNHHRFSQFLLSSTPYESFTAFMSRLCKSLAVPYAAPIPDNSFVSLPIFPGPPMAITVSECSVTTCTIIWNGIKVISLSHYVDITRCLAPSPVSQPLFLPVSSGLFALRHRRTAWPPQPLSQGVLTSYADHEAE